MQTDAGSSGSDAQQAPRPQPAAEPGRAKKKSNLAADAQLVPEHKVGRFQIYERFPEAYDVLMSRHDCSDVERILRREASAAGGSEDSRVVVADLGCGTGRLSMMLHDRATAIVAADAATPMLHRMKARLQAAAPDFDVCVDETPSVASDSEPRRAVLLSRAFEAFETLPKEATTPLACPCSACGGSGAVALAPVPGYALAPAAAGLGAPQLVVCGWSLSFVMTAKWGETRWHDEIYRCVARMAGAISPERGGAICIVETLGNFSDEPVRKNSLHAYFSDVLGFSLEWCRTDYTFQSAEEARRLLTFFFGAKVADRVAASDDPLRLKECTGIWTKRFAPTAAPSGS